jgi:hypothetical protein
MVALHSAYAENEIAKVDVINAAIQDFFTMFMKVASLVNEQHPC